MSASERALARIPAVLTEGRVPGLSVALVEGNQLAWACGFGVKSAVTGAPVTTETVFEGASLTKPLFAYLALLAVDKGLLELDVPLITYLESETIQGELIGHPLSAEGFRLDWFGRITARHVLSHSSGMPHAERGVPFPLFFEPGLKFRYSATGYYLLQLVMERLKGEPLERTAEREVFRPLSMKRSSLVWLDRFEQDAAVGHDLHSRAQEARKHQRAHAAASLYTTAGDYARFVAAVLTGKGLTTASTREMCQPQVPTDGDDAWGLGFGLQRTDTTNALWQWGDQGVFLNFVIAYPDRGLAAVYLSNSHNGLGIRDEIVRIVTGCDVSTSASLARYPFYDTPTMRFAWDVLETDARTALRKLPARRQSGITLDNRVLNQLAHILMQEERIDDAVGVLERNVEENPCEAKTYAILANAYLQRRGQGDRERALANYRQVIEVTPATAGNEDDLRQLRRNAAVSIGRLENEASGTQQR